MAKTSTSTKPGNDAVGPDTGASDGRRPDATSGPVVVTTSDAALVTLVDADTLASEAGAASAVIPIPAGGPGVGADRIAEPALGVESRPLDPRTADPRGPVAGSGPVATDPRFGAGGYPGSGIPAGPDGAMLARTDMLVVDPDEVPGTHLCEALTRITRDGRTYEAGDDVLLDFRGYEELVAIGAVPPIDWATGRPLHPARGLQPLS